MPVNSEIDEKLGRCWKLYTRCENSFNKLLQNLETSNYQDATQRLLDEFGRFRVWAGNAGAHLTGRVSLDYRLQEASHIHAELTELLEELNKDLGEGGFKIVPSLLTQERLELI